MNWLKQICIPALLTIGACTDEATRRDAAASRWYTTKQVELGAELFERHCAVCHGPNAEATGDWREPDDKGNFPPPPLNGTTHAWHHPSVVLLQTIARGGVPLGGVMPGFAGILTEYEALATIAFFQNEWPDDIYERWREIDRR